MMNNDEDDVFRVFQALRIREDSDGDGDFRAPPRSSVMPTSSVSSSSSSLLTADAPPFMPYSALFPPPGFPPHAAAAAPPTLRLDDLFDLLTSVNRAHEFIAMVRGFDGTDLYRFASCVATARDPRLFLDVAENRMGSTNLRRLLGKSAEVNDMFYRTVVSVFLPIMKLKYGHYVAMQTMEAVDRNKKFMLYALTKTHALELARDENGCVALNEVISVVTGPCRHDILNLVSEHANWLSMDTSGNFVVQHVLKLQNPFYTDKIAATLHGNYVALAFQKYGSFIVEKVLESRTAMHVVLDDLSRCSGHELMRLARNEYGNYVLQKALKASNMHSFDHYVLLVNNLKPFFGILRRGHGQNIIATVEHLNSIMRL